MSLSWRDHKPAACPSGGPAPLLVSSDQPLVGEALAESRIRKAVQAGYRVALHIAVIQPEGELVDITVQMLGTGVMIKPLQRMSKGFLDRLGLRATAALPYSKDGDLGGGAATGVSPLVGVLALFAATEIGLVNFDRATQGLYTVAAGFAQTAQHEPSRLL